MHIGHQLTSLKIEKEKNQHLLCRVVFQSNKIADNFFFRELELINVDGIVKFLNTWFITLKVIINSWKNHPWLKNTGWKIDGNFLKGRFKLTSKLISSSLKVEQSSIYVLHDVIQEIDSSTYEVFLPKELSLM